MHPHPVTVSFEEPVGQTCTPELCKDKRTGLDNGVQSMFPALAEPAGQVLFGAGTAIEIKHTLLLLMPGPRHIGADCLQPRADGLIKMPVPQFTPDPEIVYLAGVEENPVVAEIKIVILNAECHKLYFNQVDCTPSA